MLKALRLCLRRTSSSDLLHGSGPTGDDTSWNGPLMSTSSQGYGNLIIWLIWLPVRPRLPVCRERRSKVSDLRIFRNVDCADIRPTEEHGATKRRSPQMLALYRSLVCYSSTMDERCPLSTLSTPVSVGGAAPFSLQL